MKQLKYFTTDHSMVDKVQCAVRDSGLPLASVKVFERNNCDHRYDGLVLQGTRSQSRQVERETATLFVSLGIFGAAAISASLLSFVQFTLLVIFVYALASALARSRAASRGAQEGRRTVYFIVVTVGHDEQSLLSRELSHYSTLTTQ